MKTFDILAVFRRVQAIIRRRFELIIIPMLILAPGGFIVYKLLPRTYRSYTKLLLQEPKTQSNLLYRTGPSNRALNRRINILINTVNSQKIMGQLARYIAKKKGKELTDKRELFEWTSGVRGQVSIWNMGQGMVQMEYRARDPQECEDHLKYLLKLFMKESMRPQRQAIQRSSAFLSRQLKRLRDRLQKSEESLTNFKRKHSLELPQTFQANLDNYLALRKKLFQDQLDLSAARRRRDFLRRQLDLLDPSLVRFRKEILDLLNLKLKLKRYQSRYTSRHPLVRRTRGRIRRMQKSISEHNLKKLRTLQQLEKAMRVSSNFQKKGSKDGNSSASLFERYQETILKIEVLERQIKENKTQLSTLKLQLAEFPLREQQLNALKRDAEIARTIYAKVQTLHEQSLLQRELDIYDASQRVQVIEPVERPLYPIAPKKVLVLGGALFAALALSALLIAIAELLDPTMTDEEEATQILGVEVIGEVRDLPNVEL